ncbi:rhamnogalacturonan acetylesterase [Streptomyces sp. ISL-43]|uniref:rhamnogalacturonan acetylesterase n=1 Tax=Streptomyces sp. ISL-43 TaxID=2819183 RepID=UPI001BEC9EF8|nr:rhamnogalacturonan acetylesterase [Streptomyces sp. ISL-43]MBT2452049.1 rhamnogalacturonan acetylesterase [Streptomyces sp. ISL-43]
MYGQDGPRRRMFVTGDSTVVTRSVDFLPMAGWGQTLGLFLTPDLEIVNCARARASSKSFYERGRFQWILDRVSPGDYVLVCFGAVDWEPEKGLHTEPFEEYQEYLRQMVNLARQAQAHPILVLTHERRKYDKSSNLLRFLTTYPMAMREVAEETSTPLIDLYAQSLEWWDELGRDATRELFAYLKPHENPVANLKGHDDTHMRADGAVESARFVARALRDQGLVPGHWVRGLDRQEFTTEEIGWLDADTANRLTKERVAPVPEAARIGVER